MDGSPSIINGLLNLGGIGLAAAAMFWLVVFLLKRHDREMNIERCSHYNEVRYHVIMQEVYHQTVLDRLGMTPREIKDLHERVEEKVRNTLRTIPKRDSDVPSIGREEPPK